MNLAILLPALFAGALFPVQSLINAQLAGDVPLFVENRSASVPSF